jgi:hypothetical protein
MLRAAHWEPALRPISYLVRLVGLLGGAWAVGAWGVGDPAVRVRGVHIFMFAYQQTSHWLRAERLLCCSQPQQWLML